MSGLTLRGSGSVETGNSRTEASEEDKGSFVLFERLQERLSASGGCTDKKGEAAGFHTEEGTQGRPE